MSKEERKVPELRFKGFHDDWEQRKLKTITERVRGNDGRMDLPTLTISAGKGWMDQRERFSGNIAGKEQKNYTLLSKNELSYNKGNSKLAKYGVVFKLKNFEEALVPRVYHSFKTTSEADPDFIEYVFATKNPDRELAKIITSGARMDGLLNINFNDFMDIKISIPDKEEQTVISKFLGAVDNVITLHQQKANIMKEIKLLYLEKLFAIAEFLHPNIRFKGYTNEWISSQIKKYLIERNERSNIGDLVSVTIDSGVLKTESLNRKNNSSDDKSNYKVVKKGDIPYNSMRMWQGASGLSPFNGILSPAYTVLIPKETASGKFFSYQFKSKSMLYQFQKYSQGLTSDTWNLKYPLLKNIKISVPEFKEQKEIGDFLSEIDKNIELHQRRINKLKTIKKVYLDKMFI